MRVVLDTNILISACWKPGGLEEKVLELALGGGFEMAVSLELWAEYCEVLRRKKFASLLARVESLLLRVEARMVVTKSSVKLELAKDPDDNLILECALASNAKYVVTGNLKDYPLDWPVARIVNARQFLDSLGLLQAD